MTKVSTKKLLFQSVVYLLIIKLLNKLNFTFLFSPFRSNIENIDKNIVFKNECSQFKTNILGYFSLCISTSYEGIIFLHQGCIL